ncbi:MAG: hypothetical protein ACR2GY_05510 [Phycisphaerales bacterium]
MVKHATNLSPDSCPHVDHNDARCGHRFRLGRIDQAFRVCFGAFHGCPMFHNMNREHASQHAPSARQPQASAQRDAPLITVTANGLPISLRATGT